MFLRFISGTLLLGVLAAGIAPRVAAQAPATPATPALTVSGTPANDPVKGAALLAEARKALGGEDKLAAIKRLEVKGSITQVTPQQTLDGDLVMQIETPDKLRIDEEISLPGGAITINRTQALNSTEAWEVTEGGNLPGNFGRGGGGRGGDGGFRGGGGGGNAGGRLGGVLAGALGTDANAQQVSPERQAQLKEQQRKSRQTDLARYLVAFLAAPPEPAAWLGTAVTPKDEKADVLEFTTADGTATRLFLEINTHLPLMMTFSGPAPRQGGQGRQGRGAGAQGGNRGGDPAIANPAAQGPVPPPPASGDSAPQGRRGGGGFQAPQATVEMYLGDYKVENGIKMPHHITREVNGEIQEEITLKNFKFNPNFKSTNFTQPKQ